MTPEDPRSVYSDIIDHSHHQSETRPHMSLYDRAAQFSAFDALAGYSDMIAEEARLTDSQIELDDNAKELINQKLLLIADTIEGGQKPMISFVIFTPDEFKRGGKYETVTDSVKAVDVLSQKIILERKKASGVHYSIDIQKVLSIHGELINGIDECLF